MGTIRRGRGCGGVGEIVQVQGGHIIRATGKKDRHSKVYTAKGVRDRRVRLAAHTAIEFYDVQDRLGYDRPSKAVDWLITKAKDAIDRLDRLPPFDPQRRSAGLMQVAGNQPNSFHVERTEGADLEMLTGGGEAGSQSHQSSIGYHEICRQIQQYNTHHLPHQITPGGGAGNTALSLDSQSMMAGETMRSFFPAATNQHSDEQQMMNSIGGGYHNLSYLKAQPHQHPVQHHQDLGLSLHTFHENPKTPPHTTFLQTAGGFQISPHTGGGRGSISTTNDLNPWAEEENIHHHHHHNQPNQMGHFSRLLAWTGAGYGVGNLYPGQEIVLGSGNLPLPSTSTMLFGERGTTLQSRFDVQQQHPSIRAWEDLPQLPPLGFQ